MAHFASTAAADQAAATFDENLPTELVTAMQNLFGKHPGYRTSMYHQIPVL